MDEDEYKTKLLEIEAKINATYISVERIRKHLLLSFALSVFVFLLPLIGIIFAIPFLLDISSQMSEVLP